MIGFWSGGVAAALFALVLVLTLAPVATAAPDDIDSVVDKNSLKDEIGEEDLGKVIDRSDVTPLLDESEIMERSGDRRTGSVLRPEDLREPLQDKTVGSVIPKSKRARFGALLRDVEIGDLRQFMDQDELGNLVRDRDAWKILEDLDVSVTGKFLSDREIVSLTDAERFADSVDRDEMFLLREIVKDEKVEDVLAPEELDKLGSTVIDDEDIDRILGDDDLLRIIMDDDVSSSIDREALIDAIDRDRLGERLKDEKFSEISPIVTDSELDEIVDRERAWQQADRNDNDEIASIVSDERVGDAVSPSRREAVGELLTDSELRELLVGDASDEFDDLEAGEVMDDRDIGRSVGSSTFGEVEGFLDQEDMSNLHFILKDHRVDSIFTSQEIQQLVADRRIDAAAVVEEERLRRVIRSDVTDAQLGQLLSGVEIGDLLDNSEIGGIIDRDALGDLGDLMDERELGKLIRGSELGEFLSDEELGDIVKEKRVGELVNRGDIDVSPPSTPGSGRTDTPSADPSGPAAEPDVRGADVDITSFTNPSTARAGETVDVTVTVKNRGRSAETVVAVSAFNQVVESESTSLSRGETGEFTVSLTVPSDASGPERLQVEARAVESGRVVERDVASTTITVTDVSASMRVSPSSTREGRTIRVSGSVSPGGPSTAPVNVYVRGSYRGTVNPDPSGHYTQSVVADREGRNVVEIRADGARQQKTVTVLPGMSITSSSIPSKVNTGEEAEFCVTVERSSEGTVNLDLFVDGEVVSEDRVTVSGSREVCMSAVIEDAGSREIRIRAVSGPGNEVSDSVTGTVEALEPVVSATVFPGGLTLVTGENGVFTVTLDNQAAETRVFDVNVDGLEISSLTEKTVSVRSGESQRVTIPVNPGESGVYTGTVTVRSGGEVLEERNVNVRVVENPALKNPVIGGAVDRASETVETFTGLRQRQKWAVLGALASIGLLSVWYWRRRGSQVIEPQY